MRKAVKTWLTALSFCLLTTPMAMASEIEEWRAKCEAGDAQSCDDLSFAYKSGEGVEQDDAEALRYFTMACDAGGGNACYNLGIWHSMDEGHWGTTKDTAKSISFLEKACDLSELDACAWIGRIYLEGEDVEADFSKARAALTSACDGQKTKGCTGLGEIYWLGMGVDEDPVKAAALFKSACESFDALACSNLAEMHLTGSAVEESMDEAVRYTGLACSYGDEDACLAAAAAYEDGQDVKKDTLKAGHLYRIACQNGDAAGCEGLKRTYAGEACPCFAAKEILALCPRPDADATTILIGATDQNRRRLTCQSTQNYSPGSVIYDLYPGQDGSAHSCFVQSVRVEPYGSGGGGQDLSGAELAACIQTMDAAGVKLGLVVTPEE